LSPRILLLDIETAPNTAHVWGLWQQNVGTNQIMASGYVMCWAAKWHGDKRVSFARVGYDEKGDVTGALEMLTPMWEMLNEADIVVHYNGKSFDIPTLNKEFLLHGLTPPSPYRQVDLLQVVRRNFRFPSKKLDYVCRQLGVGGKVKHAGHGLWVACMANDPTAWQTMERYNKGDVRILERLYDKLLPWIQGHPNHGLYGDGIMCTNCGSAKVQSRGLQRTSTATYVRIHCTACGTWMRGSHRQGDAVELRSVV